MTIARALSNKPAVLLLDEPTGDLDSVNSAVVMQMLCELHAEGLTLVMVTHDVGLKFFADRVIWMRDGRIQRVELVPEVRRREIREKLRAQLEVGRVVMLSVQATLTLAGVWHFAPGGGWRSIGAAPTRRIRQHRDAPPHRLHHSPRL